MSSLFREIRDYFADHFAQPRVRPWALAAPILVLLICLPILRPLRHADPRLISDDEIARLASIEAIADHGSLVLDEGRLRAQQAGRLNEATIRVNDRLYSNQAPMMAALLSGPYRLMCWFGFDLDSNPNLVAYLLTVIGVTIPVAAAAGLIYRLGRIFELSRPVRAGLAAAVILGSGLISYAVVLNPHAPAAVMLLCSAACLVHVTVSNKPVTRGAWVAISGFCAALAATLEPAAGVFLILLAFVPFAMRWRFPQRITGFALYLLGATAPVVVHLLLMTPITGDIWPGMFHPELAGSSFDLPAEPIQAVAIEFFDDEPASTNTDSIWWRTISALASVGVSLFGEHGLLSHFPILIFGMLGVAAVMHRHWPLTTKMLAAASLVGALIVILTFVLITPIGTGSMFAARWFVVFLPMLLFWLGAWMRRRHHPLTWATAALALLFGIIVSIIGATNPFPREGYDRYTVGEALRQLVRPEPVDYDGMLAKQD